jgi:hypothetical protein
MRSTRTLVIGLAAALLLVSAGCQTTPYDTGANADASYDFASKKTYAFNKVRPKVIDSANGKILRAELASLLKSRGLTEVAVDQADLWFSYDVGTFKASQISWGEQSTLGEGRIVIRVIDPKTDTEVWYGWAEARLLKAPDPERRIREALEALVAQRVARPEQSE